MYEIKLLKTSSLSLTCTAVVTFFITSVLVTNSEAYGYGPRIENRKENGQTWNLRFKDILLLDPKEPIRNEKVKSQNGLVKHTVFRGTRSGCSCIRATYDCGCCLHVYLPKIDINDTGCINLTYLPKDIGISITFTIDNKVLFNETVSARNPPPLCVDIPHVHLASLCLRFYNLSISPRQFSGCVRAEARIAHVLVEDVNLGCFHLGPGSGSIPLKKISGITGEKSWRKTRSFPVT